MTAILRTLLLALIATLPAVAPTLAQEEPPPPKASPVISVSEEALPRAGGVMVFGGTGKLGLEVVKELVARHEIVTVLTRASSDVSALKELKVNILNGDALDPESLKKAFAESPFRVAVSVLGGHKDDYRVDSEGNKNAIDAAKNGGVTRFVLVSALGAGDSADVLPWFVGRYMKDYFAAKTAAEDYLKATDLDYTIIRPGLLVDGPKPGEPGLVHATKDISGITRVDLGKLVAGTVEDKATFKQIYAAVDAKRTGLWALLTY